MILGTRLQNNLVEEIQFPLTKSILWDHTGIGHPVKLHIASYRNPQVLISQRALSLAHRYGNDKNKLFQCLLVGSIDYDTDGEGVTLILDRFDRGIYTHKGVQPSTDVPGDLHVPTTVSFSSQEDTERQFSSVVKTLVDSVCSKDVLDFTKFLSVNCTCTCQSSRDHVTCQIDLDIVTIGIQFDATPINPVAILPTALSKNLSGSLNISDVQGQPKSGYLTMDKTRRLLFVLECDPKAPSLPLVGIWVSGISYIHHPYVWIACLRYLYNSSIQDRVCAPPEPFLVVLHSPLYSKPEFYEIKPTSNSNQIEFQMFTACDRVNITQNKDISREMIKIELCLAQNQNGPKNKALSDAVEEMRQKMSPPKEKRRSTAIPTNMEDFVPRASPSPHTSKAPSVVQPAVPDVSLIEDDNGGLLGSYQGQGRHQASKLSDNYHPQGMAHTRQRLKALDDNTPRDPGTLHQHHMKTSITRSNSDPNFSRSSYGGEQVKVSKKSRKPKVKKPCMCSDCVQSGPGTQGQQYMEPGHHGYKGQPPNAPHGNNGAHHMKQLPHGYNGPPSHQMVNMAQLHMAPTAYHMTYAPHRAQTSHQRPQSMPHATHQMAPAPYQRHPRQHHVPSIPPMVHPPRTQNMPVHMYGGAPQPSHIGDLPVHRPPVQYCHQDQQAHLYHNMPRYPPYSSHDQLRHNVPYESSENIYHKSEIHEHHGHNQTRSKYPIDNQVATQGYHKKTGPDFPPPPPVRRSHDQDRPASSIPGYAKQNQDIPKINQHVDNGDMKISSQHGVVQLPYNETSKEIGNNSPNETSKKTGNDAQLPTSISDKVDRDKIPPEVYNLLLQQDSQLKMLQAQIEKLIQAQNMNPATGLTGESSPEAGRPNAMADSPESQGYMSMDVTPRVPQSRTSPRASSEMGTNTSMRWSREEFVDDCSSSGKSQSNTEIDSRELLQSKNKKTTSKGSKNLIVEDPDITINLNSMDVPLQEDSNIKSFVSEMLVDIPSFHSSPERDRSVNIDNHHSPVLGESASMCEGHRGFESENNSFDGESVDTSEPDGQQQEQLGLLINNIRTLLARHNSQEEGECPIDSTPPEEGVSETGTAYSSHVTPTMKNDIPQEVEQFSSNGGSKETSVDIVTQETFKQLKKMGVSTLERIQPNNCSGMVPYDIEAGLMPKLNYVSLLLDEAELSDLSPDTSMEINALAMKYFSDEQLSELAKISTNRNGKHNQNLLRRVLIGSNVPVTSPNVSLFGMSSNNMSFATQKFMERYGLIQNTTETRPLPEVNRDFNLMYSDADNDGKEHRVKFATRDNDGLGSVLHGLTKPSTYYRDVNEHTAPFEVATHSKTDNSEPQPQEAPTVDMVLANLPRSLGTSSEDQQSQEQPDDDGMVLTGLPRRDEVKSVQESYHSDYDEGDEDCDNILDMDRLRQLPKFM